MCPRVSAHKRSSCKYWQQSSDTTLRRTCAVQTAICRTSRRQKRPTSVTLAKQPAYAVYSCMCCLPAGCSTALPVVLAITCVPGVSQTVRQAREQQAYAVYSCTCCLPAGCQRLPQPCCRYSCYQSSCMCSISLYVQFPFMCVHLPAKAYLVSPRLRGKPQNAQQSSSLAEVSTGDTVLSGSTGAGAGTCSGA